MSAWYRRKVEIFSVIKLYESFRQLGDKKTLEEFLIDGIFSWGIFGMREKTVEKIKFNSEGCLRWTQMISSINKAVNGEVYCWNNWCQDWKKKVYGKFLFSPATINSLKINEILNCWYLSILWIYSSRLWNVNIDV